VSGSIGKLGTSSRHCTVCDTFLEAKEIDMPGLGKQTVAVACKCETDLLKQREKTAALRARNGYLHTFSDDDQMVAGATFEAFQPNQGTATGFQVAKDFAENMAEWGARGFYCYGDNGSGKSHLLSAVTNYLRSRGHSVIYTTGIKLIDRAKPTWAKAEVLEAYRSCDVLVIDEIGADIPADWEIGDLFTVLNSRQGQKPILYGSNLTINELEAKINAKQKGWGTRLMERIIADTAGQIQMKADSKRFDKHADNQQWLQGRLKQI